LRQVGRGPKRPQAATLKANSQIGAVRTASPPMVPGANLHQETPQGKTKSNVEKPMGIEASELRRVMGHFATGVTVVTTHDGNGRPYGFTANAVCSLSLVPPLVLVCVDKRAESHPAVARSRVFVVNILADEQEELSRRFAVSGGEKFAGLNWWTGVTGARFSGQSRLRRVSGDRRSRRRRPHDLRGRGGEWHGLARPATDLLPGNYHHLREA